MKLKKLSAFLLALLICVQVLGLTVWATGEPDFAPALGEPPVMEQSSGSGHMTHSENNTNAAIITMDRTRTLDSIVAKAKELPHIAFNGTIATPYATTPSIVSPHTPGSLLASDMADALRAFKMVRYVTGLPYENLTFASEYNNYSQHGAVLMAASHQFTHYPTKPDDMSQAFFDIAKRGCGEANIYAGVKNISTAITGFIYDSGASNISRAGHRRWMLRPGGANYGIGLARDATGYTYISLHVFGGPGMYEHESDSYVAWPNGGDFPIQYFLNSTNLQNLPNCPWSINLGAPYQTPVKADITLKLTRTRDNKVWTMNNSTPDLGELGTTDSASMHLAVDNGGYGMQKCITFRPDVTTMGPILDGDVYKVELSGIKKTDGSAATLSYNIRFFDLANEMVRSRVSITVKSGGAALSGATVVIGGQTLTTDANGLVSLRVNNSASYPYTVSKNGYTTSTGNIAVGTSDVQQTVNLTGGSSPVNIAAASVSGFVPPAANAAPQVNTNLTPGHTSYTVAGLTWSPSVAAFGYATVYTATVTLRAASGYTFNSALTPTVNTGTPGAGTVSGIGSGNTLTFNVVFPATAALSDDYGNDFGTAYNWALTGGATNLRDGNFEVKGDVDMFRFNVPVTGSYEFFTSNNGTVDTVGTLYNSAMSQIAYDDDSAGSRNFKITATLTQGQTYYLKVAGYGNNYTGTYRVNIVAPAVPIVLNIAAASVSGFVPPVVNAAPQVSTNLTPGHTSYTVAGLTWSPYAAAFGYATVYTATVTLRAASGYTFNSALTPTVNTGTPGAGTVSGTGAGNTLTFNVVFPATAALVDDYGNDFGTAYNWALTGGATNLRDGNFEVKGDVDMFRFNVPVTGSYEFFTSNNGTVDTVGTLYNSAMSQIAYDDDSAGSRNFKITATLTQGQTYYLKVAGYGNNYTGTYRVNIVAPAVPIVLNIAAASVSGFVPPVVNAAPQVSTNLTPGHTSYTVAGLTWTPYAAAFGYATVYTATVTLRAAAGYTFNSALTPTVNTGTPGAGTVSGTGPGNTLTFNVVFPATAALVDDYGNDFGTASNWSPTAGAQNIKFGNFEVKGDVDMFKFTAPATGSYEFFTSNNGTVDTVGTLYNSAMSQIGYDDDSAGSRNFKITATLTQGQMYYLKVSSYGNNYTGAYQINIVAPAALVVIQAASVSGFVPPAVNAAPQVSTNLTPGHTSYTVAGLTWSPYAAAFGYATVYTATVTLRAASGYTFSSALTPTVNTGTPGAGTVSGIGSGNTLTFNVVFPATAALADDYGNDFGTASNWSPTAGAQNIRFGNFEVKGDIDMFKFTAPATGSYEFFTSNNGTVDTVGTLYNSAMSQIGYDDDSAGSRNFKITATLTQGQMYYLKVGSYGNNYTGAYQINIVAPAAIADDYGNTIDTAYNWAITGPNPAINGNIERLGDIDVFKFTAPFSGTYQIISTSSIDMVGTLYNSARSVLASDDDAAGNRQFKISYPLVKGQVYYVQVGTYANYYTGAYSIRLMTPPQ